LNSPDLLGKSDMKKSLLITYFFPPKLGGIENYFKNLCLNLPPDKIVVLAEPAENAEDIDKAFPFKVIRNKLFPWPQIKPSWLPLFFTLKKIIKKDQIELLQFGHYSNLVTLGWLLKKISGLPYIVYTHGVDTLLPQNSNFQKNLMRRNLINADWVIANSQYMKKRLTDFGLNKSKIVVVYPSLPNDYFTEVSGQEALEDKYGLKNHKVILTVGHLIERKGQDDVIKSLPSIIKVYPELKYLMVGEGPYRKNLEDLASKLGVRENVIFTGPIEDRLELKLPFYKAADLFVMPTRELEGGKNVESFGIVYLEAQGAGCPVIASNIGGAPETMVPDETGLLVEPGRIKDLSDTILKLLADESRRHSMGEKAKKWVRQAFSWPHQARKVAFLLESNAISKKLPNQSGVSLIIPVYQVEDTLKKCLASIFNQTFKDFEIIAVNDGSTDKGPQVLDKYKDSLTIINQDNRGAAAARNTGAARANGKYIFFCDADVVLKPTALEKMVKVLEINPQISFCYCAFRFGWRSFKALPYSKERLKKYNYISTMTLLRRDDFPGFDEKLKRFQDWDLWLTLAKKNKNGISLDETLFTAPMRAGGISRQIEKEEAMKVIINKHHL